MSTPGQLLLVTCAFLCLIPGDALLCTHCESKEPGEPCETKECEVDSEGQCVAVITYKGEEVFDKLLTCTRKTPNIVCDSTDDDPESGTHYKINCCEDSDLCNSKF